MVYKTLQLCKTHYDRRRNQGDENAPRKYTRGFSLTEKLAHYRQIPDDLDACYGWSGQINQGGYAQVWRGGRDGGFVSGHRLAHELEIGPIGQGLDVDHLCHNRDLSCPGGPGCLHRRCTNPRHLRDTTRKVNMESARRGERLGAVHHNGRKTHDKWGHEFTLENTVVSNGHRYCLECRRLRARGEHPTQIAKRACPVPWT